MSRTIEALKLLRILSDSYKQTDKYIKMTEIRDVLETDDRNIRNIIRLLKTELGIDIESKRGHDGGYKLNQDIYKYIFNLSYEDIDNFTEFISIINESDRSEHYKQSALNSLDKVINVSDFPLNKRFLYDIDYYGFINKARLKAFILDFNSSSSYDEPFHLNVVYRSVDEIIVFDCICLSNEIIDMDQPIIVLDIKTNKLIPITLKFVQSTKKIYGTYDYESYFYKINNNKYNNTIKKLNQLDIEKSHILLKLIGNLSKESSLKLKEIIGSRVFDFENDKEFYISRSKLPSLLILDIPELLESLTYNDFPINPIQFIKFYESNYSLSSPLVFDQKNYDNYSNILHDDHEYEDEDEFIIL